jgi:hypothetical protein
MRHRFSVLGESALIPGLTMSGYAVTNYQLAYNTVYKTLLPVSTITNIWGWYKDAIVTQKYPYYNSSTLAAQPDQFKTLRWVADKSGHTLGEVIRFAVILEEAALQGKIESKYWTLDQPVLTPERESVLEPVLDRVKMVVDATPQAFRDTIGFGKEIIWVGVAIAAVYVLLPQLARSRKS